MAVLYCRKYWYYWNIKMSILGTIYTCVHSCNYVATSIIHVIVVLHRPPEKCADCWFESIIMIIGFSAKFTSGNHGNSTWNTNNISYTNSLQTRLTSMILDCIHLLIFLYPNSSAIANLKLKKAAIYWNLVVSRDKINNKSSAVPFSVILASVCLWFCRNLEVPLSQ